MSVAIRIPKNLHRAIPQTESVSGIVRKLLDHAEVHPESIPDALGTVGSIQPAREPAGRYAIYMTDEEGAKASLLAERHLLSLNQLVQILLEDLLHRAGRWPVDGDVDKPA